MSEEMLNEMYSKYLENDETVANKEIRDSYSNMYTMFENYLACVSEFEFKKVFQYAYKKGYEEAKADIMRQLVI